MSIYMLDVLLEQTRRVDEGLKNMTSILTEIALDLVSSPQLYSEDRVYEVDLVQDRIEDACASLEALRLKLATIKRESTEQKPKP